MVYLKSINIFIFEIFFSMEKIQFEKWTRDLIEIGDLTRADQVSLI